MRTLALILAVAAVAAGQKQLKAGKHKPQYIASSPGAGLPESAPPSYQSHHGSHNQHQGVSNHGGFGGSPSYSSGIGKPGSAKQQYPQLLSDTRTLNTDGTINFNYQADNGLHQGETVDSDGTRRGFYSYPGADGKLITVKYTAGKNGFVAEGDHLPTQPQSAPYDPKHESHDYSSSGKQGSHHGGGLSSLGGGRGNYHHAAAPVHHGGHHGGHGGAYRQGGQQNANVYSHSSLGGGQGGGSASFANFPDFSSQFSSGIGGSPSYSAGGAGAGAGRYSGGAAHGSGHHGGASHHGGHGSQISGHPGGSQSFSSLAALGSHGGHGQHGGHANLDLGSLGSQLGQTYSGPMFTAANPYQPASNAPVNAGFDLGNGGHFSINFTPGAQTEYNPNELSGDYTSSQHGAGGAGGHGGGAQGRY